MQKFDLISFATTDKLARAVAGVWLDEIAAAQRAGKPHCVALSGGRVTQKFFAEVVRLLREGRHAGDPNFRDGNMPSLPNVHFFWADERCVPPSDAESNFKMADELLFQPLGIAPDKIHRIHGEVAPAAAAELATKELQRIVQPAASSPSPPPREERAGERRPMISDSNPLSPTLSPFERGEGVDQQPSLDLIILGMGEDGHIASLFPNATAEIINCPAPFLAVTNSPKPPPNRVTLSYAAIAAAKQVWVLASGKGKEAAFAESLSPTGKTPLARVLQSRSATKVFTDIG